MMDNANVNVVFNARTHYSTAGRGHLDHMSGHLFVLYELVYAVALVIALIIVHVVQNCSLCSLYRCRLGEDGANLYTSGPFHVESEVPFNTVRARSQQ